MLYPKYQRTLRMGAFLTAAEAEIINTPISATAAWRNRPVPHFIIVSVISYLFIAAISIVGAIIPTFATVRKSPADALRDE